LEIAGDRRPNSSIKQTAGEFEHRPASRAGDGARTRDVQLGKKPKLSTEITYDTNSVSNLRVASIRKSLPIKHIQNLLAASLN
jgi:hypothetical protein